MARIISLSSTVQGHNPVPVEYPRLDLGLQARPNLNDSDVEKAVNLILQQQNNVYNYTIKQASEILNVSSEFIRRRVADGKINAVKFGDKPMISIFELARILVGGIN